MKKLFIVGLLSVMPVLLWSIPVAAATPDENASHVANCAVTMGGEHVADCARTMERGVSECAQMKGPCDHMP